jgi:hypothetical protein
MDTREARSEGTREASTSSSSSSALLDMLNEARELERRQWRQKRVLNFR